MSRLMPAQPVPALEVPIIGGAPWSLSAQTPENFTMIVAYRGLHCPICRGYLNELKKKLPDFEERGVTALVVSTDDQERAQKSYDDWGLAPLTVGYGLPIDTARAWGLYLSKGIREGEPAQFNEPGLFLVRPDGSLYWMSISTMPFGRPDFGQVIQALDFVVPNNYPARGELA